MVFEGGMTFGNTPILNLCPSKYQPMLTSLPLHHKTLYKLTFPHPHAAQNRNTLTFNGEAFTSWSPKVDLTRELALEMKVKSEQQTASTLFYAEAEFYAKAKTIKSNYYSLQVYVGI